MRRRTAFSRSAHSRSVGPTIVVLATLACAGGAAGAVAWGDAAAARAEPDARGFQRLLGGLGMGAALDLARSDSAFDVRVTSPSSARFEPTPAGDVFEAHRDVRRVP